MDTVDMWHPQQDSLVHVPHCLEWTQTLRVSHMTLITEGLLISAREPRLAPQVWGCTTAQIPTQENPGPGLRFKMHKEFRLLNRKGEKK